MRHEASFIVGTELESRLMRGRLKNKQTWLRRHSPNGTPQTPSNQLNPAKQVKPGGRPAETKCSKKLSNQPAQISGDLPEGKRKIGKFFLKVCLSFIDYMT